MDVDEKRETTLIHDDTRCQDTRQLFIMSFANANNPMSIVCFCVLARFVYLQVYGA